MSGTLSSLAGAAGNRILANLTFSFAKTEIGMLRLDAMFEESIEYDGEVTKYPVEDGSEISDHIMQGSKVLRISGTNSNVEAYSFALLSGKSRLLDAVETIERIKEERKVLTVTTGLMRYEDMGLGRISVSRSAGSPRDGNWIDIKAELRKIRKVKLKTADVPAEAPASGRTGQTRARTNSNSNRTPSATETLASDVANRRTTAARAITNYFGVTNR